MLMSLTRGCIRDDVEGVDELIEASVVVRRLEKGSDCLLFLRRESPICSG